MPRLPGAFKLVRLCFFCLQRPALAIFCVSKRMLVVILGTAHVGGSGKSGSADTLSLMLLVLGLLLVLTLAWLRSPPVSLGWWSVLSSPCLDGAASSPSLLGWWCLLRPFWGGSQAPEHVPCAHDAAAAGSRMPRTACVRPSVPTGHKVSRQDRK